MFSLSQKNYDEHDIYALWCSGVNIFNVDRTVHSNQFLKDIEKKISEAETYYQPPYYRPVALSVTMSVHAPIDIDDRVDFIILKDVVDEDTLIAFKKLNPKFAQIRILVHCTQCCLENMHQLVQYSDGVLLEYTHKGKIVKELCPCMLDLCQKLQKPVFSLESDLLEEYSSQHTLLPIASQIVKSCLDGVVVLDSDINNSPKDVVRSLVMALHTVETGIKDDEDYLEISLQTKTPALPHLSVALAACAAAAHSGASAIILITATGRSARWLSWARPPCHVVAITARPSTARVMHLYRMIIPLLYTEASAKTWQKECRERVRFGTTFALKASLFGNGAKLVVLSPWDLNSGYSNSIQIVEVPYVVTPDREEIFNE